MNRWLNTIVSIAIPAILLCAIAHAQDFPKREAFVGFSYVNGDTNGGPRSNLYGGEFSFSENARKWVGAEVGGSGYYGQPTFPTFCIGSSCFTGKIDVRFWRWTTT